MRVAENDDTRAIGYCSAFQMLKFVHYLNAGPTEQQRV